MEYDFAICYFGLPRSVKYVYESHNANIFNVLKEKGLTYKIFMHSWKTKDSNQRVWQHTIRQKIDYDEYKLLNPDEYKLDSQEEFFETINMDDYYYEEEKKKEWIPKLLKNHICALGSQMRVYKMVKNDSNKYKYVMIIRPDAFFPNPLPIDKIIPLKDKEFMISDHRHYEGLNDRFCICNEIDSDIYMCRLDKMKDFRRNTGRITAERYLKYAMKNHNCNVKKIKWDFDLARPDGSYAKV
jgi:hypothetical protein